MVYHPIKDSGVSTVLNREEEDMPIFEYTCQECCKEFEAIVQGSETPECPSCRSSNLQKRLSVFAVGSNGLKASDLPEPCRTCGDARGSCALAG